MKRILIFLFFAGLCILYLKNLTRDIYSGDIGDLVTAAYVFGVAHPPGYPLFSFLGFILSHLPIPLPVVSKVGLISVFSSLVGLIVYYKFCVKVTKSIFFSLLSTSILAFSYLFWLTTEIPEGLALNNFFAIVLLYLAIQFHEKKKVKYLYFIAFFAGLSLTNQLYILTLVPAIALLLLSRINVLLSDKRIFFAGLLFLTGLAVYLYVPIAASRNPPINWDNASNFKNFLRLVLRQDYGGITHTQQDVPVQIRMIAVGDYLKTQIAVFSYQVLFLAATGLLVLLRKNKTLFLSLALAYLFTGVITIYFSAAPFSTATAWGVVERYYGLSTVVLMFAVPYGLIWLKKILDSKFSSTVYSYIILSYFLIIPFLLLKYNYPKTDLSKTKIGNSLARNVLASVPRNSALFVSGDNTAFSIWYVYYVLKERQDIDIINPPGVGNNIYLDKELNDYYKKNPKTKLNDVISLTFEVIRKKRRLFTTYEINPMPTGTILLPEGLVFEIINTIDLPSEKDYITSVEATWKKVAIQRRETLALSDQNFLATEMPFIYSLGLTRVGDFLLTRYDDPKIAESYYRRALWIDDTNSQAYSGLALSLFKAHKDCSQSLYNIKQAITIYPVWKPYYIQQYYFAKNCKVDSVTMDDLKKRFESLFKQNIEKQIKQ